MEMKRWDRTPLQTSSPPIQEAAMQNPESLKYMDISFLYLFAFFPCSNLDLQYFYSSSFIFPPFCTSGIAIILTTKLVHPVKC